MADAPPGVGQHWSGGARAGPGRAGPAAEGGHAVLPLPHRRPGPGSDRGTPTGGMKLLFMEQIARMNALRFWIQ